MDPRMRIVISLTTSIFLLTFGINALFSRTETWVAWTVVIGVVTVTLAVATFFLIGDGDIVAFCVLLIGLLIGFLPLVIHEANKFEAACNAIGGHTKSVGGGTVTTVGPDGKVGVGSVPGETLCLSDDGRILEP